MSLMPREQESGRKSESDKVRSIFEAIPADTDPVERTPRRPLHIALVGNFAPRKCGIATFTTDIFEKLGEFHPQTTIDVYALDDPLQRLEYGRLAGKIASTA